MSLFTGHRGDMPGHLRPQFQFRANQATAAIGFVPAGVHVALSPFWQEHEHIDVMSNTGCRLASGIAAPVEYVAPSRADDCGTRILRNHQLLKFRNMSALSRQPAAYPEWQPV